MNKKIFAASLIAAMALSASASDFNIGVSGSDKGITGFTLSVGDYYRAPAEEVRVIRRSLPNEELSVVYYLARKANRSPEYITKMRVGGKSWWDITLALGLDPRVVYVVKTQRGHAYGHDKHNKNYRFKDVEIVEIVNTRFLASYYNVSDDEIYEKRRGGRGYEDIDNDYRGGKGRGDHDEHGRGHRH